MLDDFTYMQNDDNFKNVLVFLRAYCYMGRQVQGKHCLQELLLTILIVPSFEFLVLS